MQGKFESFNNLLLPTVSKNVGLNLLCPHSISLRILSFSHQEGKTRVYIRFMHVCRAFFFFF